MMKTGMKIVKKYKGKYSKFMYLFTPEDTGANCGVEFPKYSGLFLIFGHKDRGDKYYQTNGCSVLYISDEESYEIVNALENL